MGDNVVKLKEKYNADLVFFNEGEHVKSIGDFIINDDVIKQIVVVLKQSLDTAECNDAYLLEFYSEGKKLVIIFQGNKVYGLLIKENIASIEIPEEKDEIQETKSKVVLKERKKIKIKAGKENNEKKTIEPLVEKTEEKVATISYNITASTFDDILKIAIEYLEDFAEDIINNLMRESKIEKGNFNNENIEVFLKKLNKSSSLIIGPSQSKKMIEKIKNTLT